MTIKSFTPPKRTLMGPGPSDVHERVLNAMAQNTIGHLDPAFVGMMDEVKELLRYAFQTKNAMTFPISAPGSSGMESCFVNLLEEGDTAIICQNGAFGGRMKENAERAGATVVMVQDEWGTPVDLQKVEDAFKANPGTKVLGFVHAETSTGVTSDAAALCKMATDNGALSIVDTVTSLGGIPVMVDEWGADAVYSGTQKCLSCPPGLSPVTYNQRALDVVSNRKTKVHSWFLDLTLVMGYWNEGAARSYHHTAPINALYGLHESLVMLQEEGLENSWKRHKNAHLAFSAGLDAMGLGLLVEEPYRLPELNTVLIPDGVDEAAVRKQLLEKHNLEIGAGLGSLAGKVWRIGLMGQGADLDHVTFCLNALEEALSDTDGINTGVAADAATAFMDSVA